MIHHYRFMLFVLCILLFIYHFLMSIQPRLEVVMNQCVEELFQEMLEKSVERFDYNEEELYSIHYDHEQEITDIHFNTLKLNQMLMDSLATLNQSLDEIDHSDGIRHQQIRSKDWIDYSVPIGNLFQSFYWYGKGFEIPIRISILQNLNGEIETDLKPYGINATMLTISLSLTLNAHVESWFGRKNVEVTSKLALVMQVLHGSVPDNYRINE